MISLAKPRGDRIVHYNFNRKIIFSKSKKLFQLKAIITEVKMDFANKQRLENNKKLAAIRAVQS